MHVRSVCVCMYGCKNMCVCMCVHVCVCMCVCVCVCVCSAYLMGPQVLEGVNLRGRDNREENAYNKVVCFFNLKEASHDVWIAS